MSDLANGLERQAYDQLRKARQYPAASSLRKLKEKHAKELFQEAKRLRVAASCRAGDANYAQHLNTATKSRFLFANFRFARRGEREGLNVLPPE